MSKFPNLLIIGVFKAGTTSLFHYLVQHPEVCGTLKKETHFFSTLVFNTGDITDLEEYKEFFSNCRSEKYNIEATPSYFYGSKKLIPIFKGNFPPGHKLIVIMRNPSDRLISYFNYLKSRDLIPQEEDFDLFLNKCIEADKEDDNLKIGVYNNAIKEGNYEKYLSEWLKAYESEDLFISFFDELQDPKKLLMRISKWLDIDEKFYDNFEFTVENKTRQPKFKFVHKISLKINVANERFFRKYPRIKKILRDVYFSINYSKSNDIISEASETKLNDLFKSKNIDLKNLLKDYYKEPLPAWLDL